MEELENEISTQAEENTVSLASAQALADALAKIEVYTPTTWVDNSSPDIDAEHLNKPEQAIKRVTDALNSAVDVIKDLQSQVTKNSGAISDVNNNLSNRFKVEMITDLNQITKTGWYSGGNIAQINQYMTGGWNIINAAVQPDDSARISVFNKQGLVLEVNRDGSSSYTYFPLALKSDLSSSQNLPYIVTRTNTIDKSLFLNAQFKARRTENGTGAAAFGFENVGVNSGALYLDPSDYKLHFINYEGKQFVINWTAEN